MSRFVVENTNLEGLKIIQHKPIVDRRGYFERLFCVDDLEEIIGNRRIMQINHTLTRKAGTLRGLHFQHPPHSEMKLISCLRGDVFDVAVDLRKESNTFLQWHGEILSEKNHRTICIPEGFAHGFQALTKNCELIYLHTASYRPDAEAGLNAVDPELSIIWPMPIVERSERDQNHALLSSDHSGLAD